MSFEELSLKKDARGYEGFSINVVGLNPSKSLLTKMRIWEKFKIFLDKENCVIKIAKDENGTPIGTRVCISGSFIENGVKPGRYESQEDSEGYVICKKV